MSTLLKIKLLTVALAAGTAAMSASAAYAGPGGSDSFNINTPPPKPQHISGNAAFGNNTPVARWFDAMDQAVVELAPTLSERIILGKDFKGDHKQVMIWTETAKKVAERYRQLAKQLRSMSTSSLGPDAPALQELKLAYADWYDDSAEVFEDWIRPRPAAVTREQLQDQISDLERRSQNLKRINDNLLAMDQQLRTQHDVRQRSDALARYVTKPLSTSK